MAPPPAGGPGPGGGGGGGRGGGAGGCRQIARSHGLRRRPGGPTPTAFRYTQDSGPRPGRGGGRGVVPRLGGCVDNGAGGLVFGGIGEGASSRGVGLGLGGRVVGHAGMFLCLPAMVRCRRYTWSRCLAGVTVWPRLLTQTSLSCNAWRSCSGRRRLRRWKGGSGERFALLCRFRMGGCRHWLRWGGRSG